MNVWRLSLIGAVSIGLFSSCGAGTDVGNAITDPVTASLQLSSDSNVAPTSLTLNSTSLSEAVIAVKRISLRPSSDCDGPKAEIKKWYRAKPNASFDLLSPQFSEVSIEVQRGEALCEVRMILSPLSSVTGNGKSILVRGQTSGGRSFRIESSQNHVLILKKRSVDFTIDASANFLEVVLFRGDLTDALDLDQLPGSSEIVISPEETPVLFRAFMIRLHRALKGYRATRDEPFADGDESLRDLEEDEI